METCCKKIVDGSSMDGEPERQETSPGLRPDSGESWCQCGERFLIEGRYGEAVEAFLNARALKGDMPEIHYNLGVALAACGRDQDAADSLRQAAAVKPDYLEALYVLGIILKHYGVLQDAMICFDRAMEMSPNFAGAIYNLGVVCLQLGHVLEAEILFQRVLAIRPDLREAHVDLGTVRCLQSARDKIPAFLRDASNLNPDHAEVYYYLGIALTGRGRRQEAVEAYRRALSIRPDHLQALNNVGGVLMSQGKLPEAKVCLERALEIDPGSADVMNNMGLLQMRLGDLGGAAALFRQVLDLQPNRQETLSHLGMVLQRQGAYEESIACFSKILTLDPNILEAYCCLGVALEKCGRQLEAGDVFARALAIDPDCLEASNELGHILKEQGNPGGSLACLQRILSKEPTFTKALDSIRSKDMGERLKDAALKYASNLRSAIYILMKSDISTAIGLAKLYGFFLSENFIGIYADNELERDILEGIAPQVSAVYSKPSSGIIHLATELYAWGGHTRVIERFLNAGFGDALAVFTKMPEEVRNRLPPHVRVLDKIESHNNIESVKRVVAVCASFETVILHIHMYDIISAVAAGILARNGTKVYIYNHAGHRFSFGFASARKVFELSKYFWLCGSKRGIDGKQTYVGVPIDWRESIPKPPDAERKDIMISGAPHKFIPFGEYNICMFLNELSPKLPKDVRIHIVGPAGNEFYWSKLGDSARNRITFHKALAHSEFQKLLVGCAMHIDSFPEVSGTAFVEAFMAGIPSFGLDLLAGGSYADVLRSHSVGDLIEQVVRQSGSREPVQPEFHAIREKIKMNETPEACVKRALSVMNGGDNIPLPPALAEAGCHEFFMEHFWLGREHM